MPSPSKAWMKPCWGTCLALFCWRAGTAATSHHSLHLHLAHTTQSPGEHFNGKGYLQFLETFPRRSCFPLVAFKKEHSHSGGCKHTKGRCQVWWRSTLLWPTGWARKSAVAAHASSVFLFSVRFCYLFLPWWVVDFDDWIVPLMTQKMVSIHWSSALYIDSHANAGWHRWWEWSCFCPCIANWVCYKEKHECMCTQPLL